MNKSTTPRLAENAKAAGLLLERTDAAITWSIDKATLGMSCIELIGQLENVFAKAHEQSQVDYIDESGGTARKMLALLNDFANNYLSGNAARQADEEIEKAALCSHAYDEVLKTRPFSNALMRAFWKAEETPDISAAHLKLGDNLVRATAATLYHAIMILGIDSDLGHEIDQSTVIFVTELNQSW
ncbi:MAG: hypothetical protein P8J33_11580 [Pirellulaceae bacterium]|nr:hypothetical protein [Pirellulaceae bacterium]